MFNVLDTYHKLALQGKLNLYDFYLSILQKTDNCGRKKVVISQVCSCIGNVLLTSSVLVPISRDVALCSPMERYETDQTRWWLSCRNWLEFCP